MDERERLERFGEVEAVYRPSNGQTFAGTLMCAAFAAGGFAAAVVGCGLDVTNRVCGALFGLIFLALGAWLFRLRKWRLVLFAGGVVQVRAGGVDELGWAEVREVEHTCQKGFGDPTVSVTFVRKGGGPRVVVNPVNLRARKKMFRTLLAAAGRHNVPVRVVWQESS
jgi:hypothetical protein